MKLNSAIAKFLTNKMVLNVVALLAIFNIIGYLMMGYINSVLYFIITAVLVRFFSKNMIIVLGIPLILVNLFAIKGNTKEGMDNNNDAKKNQSKIDKLVSDNKTKNTTIAMQPLEHNNQDNSQDNVQASNDAQASDDSTGEQQGFEPGRRKNRGYQIDYASTIEDAYDELNNILGSDGINRLTSDTQKLMKQQMQLAEAMKGMGSMVQSIAPMVQNLKGMMGQLGEDKNGLESLKNLADKFSPK